jgi:hypothetical protein
MAKRVDHDSTMEVSSSQLVPGEVKRPVPHQAPGVSKNDVSMWIGGVVGADEFAGTKKQKSSGRGLRVVLLLLLVAAIAGAAGYFLLWRDDTTAPSAAPSPTAPTATALPGQAPADAMVASDAAALAATSDAGIDAGVGLVVDAISGLPEKPPPTKKKVVKKPTKKPVVKKKPRR